ncbi:MAG TPA: hypothetical protein VMJ32_16725 [Pirellulales bacterium]|nr:hypothetical protein [Pirellulales bacterium]
MPPLPERPELPEPALAKPRGSLWTLVIVTAMAAGFFISLYFLAGELGPIVLGIGLILGSIFVIACLHYLLWGRWLGDSIRREVEAEEQIEQANLAQTRREQTP